MATQFSVDEDKCDGLGCQADSGVTYIVKEKKSLCEECATKNNSARKVSKDSLFCKMHDKPVKLYCQDHELAVCQICAIKDHQKPCQLENVPVVLEKKRDQVLNMRPELKRKEQSWKTYNIELRECEQKCETDLKSVEKKINDYQDDKLARRRKEERDAAKVINDEADEEIRKINEIREARLKRCQDDLEKDQQEIESKRRELLDVVKYTADKTQTKIKDLNGKAGDVMQAIIKTAERLEYLLEDDEELLKGAHELITEVSDNSCEVPTDYYVSRITNTVRLVTFNFGNVHLQRLRKWHTGEGEENNGTCFYTREIFNTSVIIAINHS